MLNKLLVVTAIVAFAGIAGTASAEQAKPPRYFLFGGDSTTKSKQDKPAKKKTDKAKDVRPESSNPADQNAQDNEGQDQPWESELFVNRDPLVIGESTPILTK